MLGSRAAAFDCAPVEFGAAVAAAAMTSESDSDEAGDNKKIASLDSGRRRRRRLHLSSAMQAPDCERARAQLAANFASARPPAAEVFIGLI